MVNKCKPEAPKAVDFVVDVVILVILVVIVVAVALLVVIGHIIFIVVNKCYSEAPGAHR